MFFPPPHPNLPSPAPSFIISPPRPFLVNDLWKDKVLLAYTAKLSNEERSLTAMSSFTVLYIICSQELEGPEKLHAIPPG